jgi:predicted ATPase/transcriptional regulator with XRE-family HTH domain
VSTGTASFGDVLRRLRVEASLSQEQLAERAGLSVRGIGDLERGRRQAPRLETVRMLADALGLSPDERTALLAAARPAVFQDGAPPPQQSSRGVLPVPLTRLIGRERELRALGAVLQDDVRLVTVTGVGGSGKTRLAVAVAAEVAAHYADGVVFVDLSPLADPARVLPALAAALGVRESADRSLIDSLVDNLASSQLLLVLDNCERVLASSADIVAVLAASPGVTVLATSREPFHVRGEREYPLLPLPVPDTDHLPPLAALAQVPALALFVERATASQPDFTLTPENAPAIAGICQRLEGLPLAIELAAARVKSLPPAALLARLDRRLPLLTGGGRDLPTRQRTMRDAIAWSYDLLSPDARALFRGLSVFAGGFTLEAAEAVSDRPGDLAVLDGIRALVEQSLLRQSAGRHDEPRYQMLETVREFGLEHLTLAGEADATRARHARHFLALAGNAPQGINVVEDGQSLAHAASEQDNLGLALTWFDECGERDAFLRVSALVYALWFQQGLHREAVQGVEDALRRSTGVVSAGRVQALNGAGMLALFRGDYGRAATFFDEALAVARALGDSVLLGFAMNYAALVYYRRGDYGRAEALVGEAYALLSYCPDAALEAHLLHAFGEIALAQRQFARAARRYEDALACLDQVRYVFSLSDIQAGLAGVRYCTGDITHAAALYRESLQRSQDRNLLPLLVSALLGLAGIAVDIGQAEIGAGLVGAAEGVAATLGMPIFPRDLPIQERSRNALMTALGENQLTALREQGRTLPVDLAVAEALRVAEAASDGAPARRS